MLQCCGDLVLQLCGAGVLRLGEAPPAGIVFGIPSGEKGYLLARSAIASMRTRE